MLKQDLIYNALLVGMSLPDAFVFANCTEKEILEFSAEPWASKWAQLSKQMEYGLLQKLQCVIDKQVNRGVESALTWLLTKTNPRYTDKPMPNLPEIHLSWDSTAEADEIKKGE